MQSKFTLLCLKYRTYHRERSLFLLVSHMSPLFSFPFTSPSLPLVPRRPPSLMTYRSPFVVLSEVSQNSRLCLSCWLLRDCFGGRCSVIESVARKTNGPAGGLTLEESRNRLCKNSNVYPALALGLQIAEPHRLYLTC